MSFKKFNLHSALLQSIKEQGYEIPTLIQEQAIPKILEGCDLLATAQTGTGKTAAFMLPILDRLLNQSSPQGKGPRVLILVPTRELAMQVASVTIKYSKHLAQIKTVCIYGGTTYPEQINKLSRPYDILVATPGRLIDHIERGRIDFSRLEVFVMDEADRMLDMGFIDPVKQIASLLPKKHQTLMFSATIAGQCEKLSKELLHNPVEIRLAQERLSIEGTIEQRLHAVEGLGDKHRLLEHLLEDESLSQIIVFIATKFDADGLTEKLLDLEHNAAALHGDLPQRKRSRTLQLLRDGKIRILVATDVAARGIDVPTISHVINFDLPRNVEDYVHRIGRTGRAGALGVAISFVSPKDRELLRRIERFTGQKVIPHVIEGLTASFSQQAPEPQQKRKRARTTQRKFSSRKEGGSNYRFDKTNQPKEQRRSDSFPPSRSAQHQEKKGEKKGFDPLKKKASYPSKGEGFSFSKKGKSNRKKAPFNPSFPAQPFKFKPKR